MNNNVANWVFKSTILQTCQSHLRMATHTIKLMNKLNRMGISFNKYDPLLMNQLKFPLTFVFKT